MSFIKRVAIYKPFSAG